MHKLASLLIHARLAPCAWVTVLLLAVIGVLAPQQLLVAVYKANLIMLGGWIGYWLDRWTSPYARPHDFMTRPFSPGAGYAERLVVGPGNQLAFGAALLRRAMIMGACIIAVALGA